MERRKLAKRYRSLWTGEAVSILLFIGLFLFYALPDGEWHNWIIRAYSLFVVICILLQGVSWWRHKLDLLNAEQRQMSVVVLRRFAFFKKLNWVLIFLFPLALYVKWSITGAVWSTLDFWFGTLFMLGALLEQINYYYYQLMYDNPYDWAYLRQHRHLRRGSIAKALRQL